MKLKFDKNSIKAKIGMNFILFALVLMIFIWGTQVLFLNTFYQTMKENATQALMRDIASAYDKYDTQDFIKAIEDTATTNDIHVYVQNTDGTPIFSSNYDAAASRHSTDIQKVTTAMLSENKDTVSILIRGRTNDHKTLACGKILSEKGKPTLMAYIISPLFPMESTIGILKKQLLWVTGMALILAALLALYLSNRISTPIRNITKNANRLAQGEYGIVFQGGHYTEVSELADTLTRTSIELEKSTSLQKDLIANVSHDLKTPLTMVKSYAEMIRDLSGNNPEKREKHLEVIIEEADRLNTLVSDLLTLSRIQSGAIIIKSAEFNLHSEVDNIFNSYKLLMEEDGYKINVNCPENLVVKGDPERIKQVFANLINNAIKFCGDDKTVNVTVQKKGRYALCQIQDHGNGIPKEELPRIWERYYKSSSNMVRSTTGSGLGLSIVKEILSLHKARYGANSTLGEGTTFWFELELAQNK